MTRRSYRKPHVTVSLFPFLAVLVCTMGALIVLLVLVVQQARVHATIIAEPPPTEEELAAAEELELAAVDHQWRREILEQQRLEMTAKQADHRLQLSHLEDHIRRLEERFKQLQAEALNLATSDEPDLALGGDSKSELAELRRAIDKTRQQLEQAKEVADKRPRSFAIVPYRGPHGTARRPIFIECTARGIVLQPEGIVITPVDLSGPLGPGNPLDAALRAIREYLVAHGLVGEAGEPYPLLVVRPGGTEAYGAAQNAMKNWDDEFGYELIEEDVNLEYPAADPGLRDLISKSLADARQRQAILAAAMPSQFGGRGSGLGGGPVGVTATPYRGGFVPTHQASTGPDGDGSGRGNGRRGSRQSGRGANSNAPQNAGNQTPQNQGQDSGTDDNPLRRGSQQQANQTSRGGGQAGGQDGPNVGGAAAGAASGSAGAAMSAVSAGNRGANWALPKASRHATGVTRPVRVACWPDRLIILPEQGKQHEPRTVIIRRDLASQLDDFVSEIWNHTDSWGLALAGGYWKPTVNVEVAPGGEAMYAELERLMAGSGLEVKRKSW